MMSCFEALQILPGAAQASFHCLDEFDVFMDSVNRGVRCMCHQLSILHAQ
jgi:hypothetical protein